MRNYRRRSASACDTRSNDCGRRSDCRAAYADPRDPYFGSVGIACGSYRHGLCLPLQPAILLALLGHFGERGRQAFRPRTNGMSSCSCERPKPGRQPKCTRMGPDSQTRVSMNLPPGHFDPEAIALHVVTSRSKQPHLRGGLFPRFPPDGLPVVLGALGGLPPPLLPPPPPPPPPDAPLPLPPLLEFPIWDSSDDAPVRTVDETAGPVRMCRTDASHLNCARRYRLTGLCRAHRPSTFRDQLKPTQPSNRNLVSANSR